MQSALKDMAIPAILVVIARVVAIYIGEYGNLHDKLCLSSSFTAQQHCTVSMGSSELYRQHPGGTPCVCRLMVGVLHNRRPPRVETAVLGIYDHTGQ
jgi:hypothetical protein